MRPQGEKGSEGADFIGFERARDLVCRHIVPLDAEDVSLPDAPGRVLAREVLGRVDSPGADVSLKDGYAVRSEDTIRASKERPARLRVLRSRFAGERVEARVPAGGCARITSGAVMPEGADAVVGTEFCTEAGEEILVSEPAGPGLNVLARGTDIAAGSVLGRPGERLTPGSVGRLAAGGLDRLPVHRLPTVSLVGTGDEVIAPGEPLERGQLYASNLVTLSAWLRTFGISSVTRILPDRKDVLTDELPRACEGRDALLTSGGAWGSERDLVVGVLERLGWKRVFHRVRLGPGKAVGFGMLEGRPVFCLPGGPPSNEMAFLQLALPGILRLAGWRDPPFPFLSARLTETVGGREIRWTQFRRAKLHRARDGTYLVTPVLSGSRLESIALAECLIRIPEGVEALQSGQWVSVQVLNRPAALSSEREGV
jgi:molybdopterin molybdotransferase